ncbi:hypothetical protein [Verrucomicrobium sp. BvORR106]|uniref:hypothetical protein n=1 Tax=Verrucomicrobium sp. BvORR106 TaxID=1403819 RepID=UPI002240F275|nr:hypothetical protein [Verrucomicrobium sp. BvORR106]
MGVELGFRGFACDRTTEDGADEIYMLVFCRRGGATFSSRLPRDLPQQELGHWDMNDGGQGWKSAVVPYSGDAHGINDGVLLTLDGNLKDGESVEIQVIIMEEDGGNTKKLQEVGSQVLQQTGDPYAVATGVILGALTNLGFNILADTDDFIGSFGVKVVGVGGGRIRADWKRGDSVTISQPDPEHKNDRNRNEFRFNGSGSNYVGWFWVTR